MATGLPVVTTPVSGIPEIVVDGRNGLLVPERDAAALAAAIGGLLDDPVRRAAIGAAARATICDCFDSSTTTRALLRLFEAEVGVVASAGPLGVPSAVQA